ncbi:hypothetical protein P7C70_g8052, partial [Phenoliferia sp. Uapishka_3]
HSLPFSSTPPSPSTISLLTTHLRSVILLEPPGSILSRTPTPNFLAAMSPAFKPDCTDEDFVAACDVWLEAYSPGIPDAKDLPKSGTKCLSGQWGKDAWEPQCLKHGLEWRLSADAVQVREITEKAIAKVVDGGAGGRLETIPIGLINGGRTGDYFEDAMKAIGELWKKDGEGRKRKTAEGIIAGTNHFAFIHEPKLFLDGLVEMLGELGC